jgi:hypothetical protein
MDPQRIGAGSAARPTLLEQVVLGDHTFLGGQQPPGETLMNRRQLDPQSAIDQPPVAIDHRHGFLVGSSPQAAQAGPDVAFVARQPDPILKDIARFGGIGGRGDQQEPWDSLLGETRDFVTLFGPVHHHDVSHGHLARHRAASARWPGVLAP